LLVVRSFDQKKISHWPMLTFQQLCTSFQCLPDSPPRLAGWGIFQISGGSRVQQIRPHPPSQPLLEACKDINLMRVQNGLIEIKCTQKKQLSVLLLLSAITVWNVCCLRLHSGQQKTKTTICLFGFLRKNPWLNTAMFKRMAFVVTWHNKFWNTSFTTK
jgi:hypothetical protein